MAKPRVTEIGPSGHYSVARPKEDWYIACPSDRLRRKPLGIEIFEIPLVLWRDAAGQPVALLDRCAHRNVPLSIGKVVDHEIECAYHGWKFDNEGVCRLVPSLCGPQEGKARRVDRYPVREQQGYVWVFINPDGTPQREPYEFPHKEDPKYLTVEYQFDFESTMHATLENILDVPHTAFLHRGLFRGVKQNRITAVVRRFEDRIEAEYVGEPRPQGLIGKIIAPQGGEVRHWDRFLLPSIAQVEYQLGRSHLMISSFLTPISDFLTRMYAVLSVRLPFGGAVVKRALLPFALKVVRQDAEILKRQTEAVQRFGGEQFVSTPVDLLGPQILRMLRQAERGELPKMDAPAEEEVEMLA